MEYNLNKNYLIPFSKNENNLELISNFNKTSNDFKEFVKLQINNRANKKNKDNILISAIDWNDLENKLNLIKTNEIDNKNNSNTAENEDEDDEEPIIVFLFSGQGAQWNYKVMELYDTEPIFKETMDEIDKYMEKYYGFSTISKLRNSKDHLHSDVNDNQMICQTALLMAQVSCFKYYKNKLGLKPLIVLGHSFGEVVASYASGMINDLETLCYIIYQRGFQQQKTFNSGKGMAWIDIGEDEFIKKYVNVNFPAIEVACLLSPSNIVVGGDINDLEQLLKQCKIDEINTRTLSIPTAFHHSVQDSLKDDILNLKFKSSAPSITHISTVTGDLFNDQFYFNSEYMFRNLRDQAKLMIGISNVFKHIETNKIGKKVCFIEVGPRPSLLNYIKILSPPTLNNNNNNNNNNEIDGASKIYFKNISVLSTIQRDKGLEGIHETIQECYKRGYKNIYFNSQFD